MTRTGWMGACVLFWLSACGSGEDGGTSANGGTGGGAIGGGVGILDASFGGFPAGGSGGAAGGASGGSSSGGTAGSGAAAGGGGVVITCSPNGPLDCSDPNATNWDCADQPQNYGNALTQAIEQVLAEHSDWFDYSNGFACCPVALQPAAFVDAVVAAVAANGLCSTPSPLNPSIEVVVKKNNECEESWAVLTSANVVRNPPHHQSTCVAVP